MNSFFGLSPQALRRAADLQEQILALESELASITGSLRGKAKTGRASSNLNTFPQLNTRTGLVSKVAKEKGRRKMSPAAKAKIAAAARARWKKAKAAGKNSL